LSRDHFVEVFVCVQTERGLDARMAQDALHGLRVLFRLVHKPIREAVSKVMENLFEVVDALYENMGHLAISSNLTIPRFRDQFGTVLARRIGEMRTIVNLWATERVGPGIRRFHGGHERAHELAVYFSGDGHIPILGSQQFARVLRSADPCWFNVNLLETCFGMVTRKLNCGLATQIPALEEGSTAY
jgi:hypothetical protein